MRNKIIIILIVVILILSIISLIIINNYYPGKILPKQINISYLAEAEINNVTGNSVYIFANDWTIINNTEEFNSITQYGPKLPSVNFGQNYMIVSRYKVKSLSYFDYSDCCLGVPDGRIKFDYASSEKDKYYFYLMEPIMLSQSFP